MLVLTGILWGCTNPFIRQGTKGLRKVCAKTRLGQAYAEIIFLLGNWRYVVPWLINQCGSLVYLSAVQRVPLSLAVPTANSLAFAFTALTGASLGIEEPLDFETKLYNVHQYQLKTYYDEVINNINSDMDDLPQYFCFECAYLLYKYHKFKEKCSIGHKILKEMSCRGAQFKARAENDKYKSAPFKCTDCFKGFSKENILKRHKILRHNEIYKIECPFCHMRFKLNCFMQKHLRSHYTKYECRRCNVVYPLEGSALFHEEFHSGVIRTCRHCNEEFRHSSTYYSHLRTHKSEFVCSVCGSSFVSEAGLHQHKRIKHCDSVESPDDEEMNTFCTKCDISFESRPAYDEHLLHSIKHIEDIENDNEVVLDKRKKVLGKRIKEKITGQLSKKSRNMTKTDRKSCKKRRQPRKPTTCHQCGKHFETQAACMKHHVSEHPRTSFTAPHQRHICEICGASLAPGSVIAHQNMHTREKLHACETCGKQFYTTISLKRHSVTHTGEKPFPCSLCDKRFTQSNSMKLHYRTFHLKQPYPKRNRRKKKINDSMEESHSEDSSDVKTKKIVHEQRIEPSAVTVQVISENGLFNYCG
ncbi:unnamed protein product [Danaus chrysippus]|uniref:(African queen) hypothetical protein n=1 Tax=Danaus chrysippus TaxID=151541 RepID=A0A8J2VWU9_9NEOP|nr:unnamed protein product [Danaus chrysippus]